MFFFRCCWHRGNVTGLGHATETDKTGKVFSNLLPCEREKANLATYSIWLPALHFSSIINVCRKSWPDPVNKYYQTTSHLLVFNCLNTYSCLYPWQQLWFPLAGVVYLPEVPWCHCRCTCWTAALTYGPNLTSRWSLHGWPGHRSSQVQI